MREKLIELHKILCKSLHFNYDDFQDAMTIDTLITAENLIANGVTISVRCKDCYHFRKHKDGDYCYAKIRPTREDDFCSYYEKRGDSQ